MHRDRYNLPAYLYTDTGRAYLVLSTDIYGRWNAGYYEWIDPDEDHPDARYRIYGEVIEDAKNPLEAMKELSKRLRTVK